MEQQLYAWFSSKQAELAGTAIYKRADGEEVEISQVGSELTPGCKWEDAVFLGRVQSYVRPGQVGSLDDHWIWM